MGGQVISCVAGGRLASLGAARGRAREPGARAARRLEPVGPEQRSELLYGRVGGGVGGFRRTGKREAACAVRREERRARRLWRTFDPGHERGPVVRESGVHLPKRGKRGGGGGSSAAVRSLRQRTRTQPPCPFQPPPPQPSAPARPRRRPGSSRTPPSRSRPRPRRSASPSRP